MTSREFDYQAGETAEMPARILKRDVYVHPILATFSDPQMAWIIQESGKRNLKMVELLRNLIDEVRG